MNRVLIAAVVLIAIAGCSREASPPMKGRGLLAAQGQPDQPAALPFARSAKRIATEGSFASMPDRGELLDYSDSRRSAGPRSTRRDGAYTWRRIELSEEHAFRAVVNGGLRVQTPSGEMLEIVYDHHEEHASGDWTWVGHLPEQPGTQTILTFGADAVFGSIGQVGKRSLRITTKNNAAWLVETDPAKLVGIASAGANPRRPDHLAVPKVRLQSDAELQPFMGPQSVVPAIASSAAAENTIDIVVGYTQGFVSEHGSASAALTRLNYLVAVGNQALVNSQVTASIRLVHSLQVNYTDNSINESALEQLTGYDVDQQQYTNPNPAFNALRAAREQYGADLVALVRGFVDPEQDGCGIAWLIGGGRSGILTGDGQDYFGYAVVGDGDDVNEGDGQTYFCRDESFIHELAHNMGSQHDRESAEDGDGSLDPDDYGALTYSFGLKTSASAGNFYTVMAYGDQGQTDYRVFSNPRITFCGGHSCGSAQFEDNARSLSQTAPIIAMFRRTVVPGSHAVVSDFDGDGRSDIFWRSSWSGGNQIWRGGVTPQVLVRVPDQNLQVVGVGDFDGDGRSDVLWRNLVNGNNFIWKGAAASSLQWLPALSDVRWKVAGIGDFDGDGRSDIFWRSSWSGGNMVWKGGVTPQVLVRVPDQNLQIVGIGDFDGDGRSDALWRNLVNGNNFIWRGAAANSLQWLPALSDVRWKAAGIGDFDGDGRSDIFWRSSWSGGNMLWKGGITPQVLVRVPDQNLQVVKVGDFDGDGRSDALWRNLVNGNNFIWKGAAANSLQWLPTLSDVRWEVQPEH